MIKSRVIPILQIQNNSLVKTTKFKNAKYIGDAINTIKMFNELEVDELVILDIDSSRSRNHINFRLLEELANECFMPLAYGGGIKTVDEAKKIINLGFEKIIINSTFFYNPNSIQSIVSQLGSQSVVGAIDVYKTLLGNKKVSFNSNKKKSNISPEEWAIKLINLGVGEILVTSIYKEGTWEGLDTELLTSILENIQIPVIFNGGANSSKDIKKAISYGASGVGVGSMVIYQKKGMGVLVNTNNLYNPWK